MARKDVPDDVGARERLVDLQRSTAGVGEDIGDTLAFKSFNEDISAFSGFARGKSGNKSFRGGGGGRDGDERGGCSWFGA